MMNDIIDRSSTYLQGDFSGDESNSKEVGWGREVVVARSRMDGRVRSRTQRHTHRRTRRDPTVSRLL